ncbi:MAG: hypothetical protein ABL958_20005 [Bdellovibrionia bacterium]
MKTLIQVLVLLAIVPAFAAPKRSSRLPSKLPAKKAADSDLKTRTVEVNVPQVSYPVVTLKSQERSTEMAVQISSWVPNNIDLETRIPASKFNAKLPQISGHVLIPLARPAWAAIWTRVGLGYQSFERTGSVDISSIIQGEKQNAHLLTGTLGVLVEPDLLSGRIFGVNAEAKAIPAYLMAERSAMGKETNQFGVGYELAAGISTHVMRIFTDESSDATEAASDVRLDLTAGRVFGSTSAVDFEGYNVRAGLRWILN